MQRITITMITILATPALAQSDVDPDLKFAWGENVGFLNFHDAGDPVGSQGVRLHNQFLSGYVWGENIGYVSLGDGSPANGARYANVDGSDTGVNLDPATGELYGLAWAENVGWINFDTRSSLGIHGQQARLDLDARRLRGYAWGENIGWVNLDDSEHYVAFGEGSGCGSADIDSDGDIDADDFFGYLDFFATGDARADVDGDGDADADDFFGYLDLFSQGC